MMIVCPDPNNNCSVSASSALAEFSQIMNSTPTSIIDLLQNQYAVHDTQYNDINENVPTYKDTYKQPRSSIEYLISYDFERAVKPNRGQQDPLSQSYSSISSIESDLMVPEVDVHVEDLIKSGPLFKEEYVAQQEESFELLLRDMEFMTNFTKNDDTKKLNIESTPSHLSYSCSSEEINDIPLPTHPDHFQDMDKMSVQPISVIEKGESKTLPVLQKVTEYRQIETPSKLDTTKDRAKPRLTPKRWSKKLLNMSVREFNEFLKGPRLTSDDKLELKKYRRRMKNREYTRVSRLKRRNAAKLILKAASKSTEMSTPIKL